MSDWRQALLASRISHRVSAAAADKGMEEEGGCGVVGFAATVPVAGRHIFEPSIQMHNRGNGKGGGIAAAGLVPEQLGVDAETLKTHCLLQVALLNPAVEKQVEETFVLPHFHIAHREKIAPACDFRDAGLEVRPPDVLRYFVRVRDDVLSRFVEENRLSGAPARAAEDEFIYRNSFRLNQQFYAALGEKAAFVMSHARDLMIFKIVGYAEQVVQYYGLEDTAACVWIAHQRYPTKGRVWHPAGAHPFIGMNEALVHNGDFANYFSIGQYLRQHGIAPLFLTDTEVSVLLFDLLTRAYGYPLEYAIEAIAPTTELDFDRLPEEKKKVYRAIQRVHVRGSPDGPWFFIIAATEPDANRVRLLGITDTSMLRPQVFALQEGDVSIGLVASEKQAIDATLKSLASEDARFRPVADRYWNARGGSHTDGGAFVFTLEEKSGARELVCTDKFGTRIHCPPGEWGRKPAGTADCPVTLAAGETAEDAFRRVVPLVASWDFDTLRAFLTAVRLSVEEDPGAFERALEILSLLNDRRYDCGRKKRSVVLQIIRDTIDLILDAVPGPDSEAGHPAMRIEWNTRKDLRAPRDGETTLVLFARDFPPEGDEGDSRLAVAAYRLGWRRMAVYGLKGQRFTGCGFGAATGDVRLDLFGSSGDYVASGMDGMELRIHDSGQDQLGQIMKRGRLVVFGDVGQAFMYGAKGGEVYVMGNAAGRPLINAVGRPRVVINGTCLDYLAESFMAGDPHAGGGFVVLNGIEFDDRGAVREQATPYPGANLFSLASGGALFVRDPHRMLVPEQLNGGEFAELSDADWGLILPYLESNERLFGISIERDLLAVNGERREPREVYRKVKAVRLAVLSKQLPPE